MKVRLGEQGKVPILVDPEANILFSSLLLMLISSELSPEYLRF